MDILAIALFGLAFGAVYAGVGMGVVVTHRATGVVNVGQVALGMWGAFVAHEVHTSGRLVFPWAGLPAVVPLEPLNGWRSALVGLASSVLLAVAVQWLVFRPLRRASQLARIVATVGLLLTVQALIVLHFDTGTRKPDPLIPVGQLRLGSVALPLDRVALGVAALTVAVALAWWQRRSLVGSALRAAAEDEVAVGLAGWSPNRLSAVGWGLGAAVTAVLVILASPSVGLSPGTFPALLVPGLACALVGRLESFVATAVAGLSLGCLQALAIFVTAKPWWPVWGRSGLADALPFLVIVVVLVRSGRRFPERGAVLADRLPAPPRGQVGLLRALVAVAIGGVVLVTTTGTLRFAVITSLIFALFTLSLVVVTGLVGQVSLAQAAIAGVAAFVMVKVTPFLPFPVNALAGVAAAVVVGVAVGLPALRIRGATLAVVTLSAAVAVDAFVFNNTAMNPPANSTLPSPTVFGLDLGIRAGAEIARLPFGLLVLAVVALSGWSVARITRGQWGRRFLAVRSDERAAAAAGIDVARTKVVAFAIASLLAGIGGVLLAYSQGQASASSFTVLTSLAFVVYAYLGGITSVTGAFVAAAMAPAGLVFALLETRLDLGRWYALASGIGLLLAIIQNPSGVVGAMAAAGRRVVGRRRSLPDRPDGRAAESEPVRTPPVDFPGGLTQRSPGQDAPVLRVDGLTVRYGGVVAVDDVSFSVESGEVVGLIGANGAGKSSIIDAITGFTPYEGTVGVGGTTVDAASSHERYRAGLARTWQTPTLFDDLSIRDNVAVAASSARFGDLWRDLIGRTPVAVTQHVDDVLAAVGAEPIAHATPDELPAGRQRTAAMARAVAARPRVLLADEPAAGLDPQDRIDLGRRLRRFAQADTGVLLVEHDLDLVLTVCDRIVVIDLGRVIAVGTPDQVRTDPAVITAYLGAPHPAPAEGARG